MYCSSHHHNNGVVGGVGVELKLVKKDNFICRKDMSPPSVDETWSTSIRLSSIMLVTLIFTTWLLDVNYFHRSTNSFVFRCIVVFCLHCNMEYFVL